MISQILHQSVDVVSHEVGADQALDQEEDGHSDETEYDDGGVHVADALETVDPVLAVPTDGVQCTPETVGKVEPDSCQPYYVEGYDNGIREVDGDEGSTVGGSYFNTIYDNLVETHDLGQLHL